MWLVVLKKPENGSLSEQEHGDREDSPLVPN
jgi:hypothetical protein